MVEEKCCSCSDEGEEYVIGEYVCYCNHVAEEDIVKAIESGGSTVKAVIKITGAMKNSDCATNNPKGTCCYSDIVHVFNKYK